MRSLLPFLALFLLSACPGEGLSDDDATTSDDDATGDDDVTGTDDDTTPAPAKPYTEEIVCDTEFGASYNPAFQYVVKPGTATRVAIWSFPTKEYMAWYQEECAFVLENYPGRYTIPTSSSTNSFSVDGGGHVLGLCDYGASGEDLLCGIDGSASYGLLTTGYLILVAE